MGVRNINQIVSFSFCTLSDLQRLNSVYTRIIQFRKKIKPSVPLNHFKESTQMSDSFANRTSLSCVAYQRGLTSITNMCKTFLCPVSVKTLIKEMFFWFNILTSPFQFLRYYSSSGSCDAANRALVSLRSAWAAQRVVKSVFQPCEGFKRVTFASYFPRTVCQSDERWPHKQNRNLFVLCIRLLDFYLPSTSNTIIKLHFLEEWWIFKNYLSSLLWRVLYFTH